MAGNATLWNLAYDSFVRKSPKLDAAFKEILSQMPSSTNASSMEEEMSELVRREVDRMEAREWKITIRSKSIRIRTQMERILKILSFVKDLATQAAQLDPVYAGLPVAGLYLILSFATCDKDSREALFNGIESIANVVRKYASIENVYLSGAQNANTKRFEDAVVILYERILQFEAKAACHCNHNIAFQTLRNLVEGESGWKDGIKAVEQADAACSSLLPALDQETQSRSAKSLLEITIRQNELIELSTAESKKQSQAILEELRESRRERERANEVEEQKQCLTTLRTTDYVAPKKLLPKRDLGTCKWFLQHSKYQEWLKADAPALLWVTADPGCGKSVLAKFLVDEFIQITGQASHVCYFFFRAGTETESASAALCAMLHQLFCQDEKLLSRYGVPQYHQDGSKLASLFESLWEIFMNVCQDTDRDDIVCIIDGLDECDASNKTLFVSRLAEMIADREHKVNAKFLITSRPDKLLRNAVFAIFGSQPFNFVQVNGENESEAYVLAEEINVVIQKNIDRFHKTRKALLIHDSVHEELQKKIFDVKNRTYLWVSIVFAELQDKAGSSEDELLQTLQTLPTRVETAYEKCLARIAPTELEDAKKILHIIVSTVRDLNLEELKIAFTITKDHTYQKFPPVNETAVRIFRDTVRHLCGLLVRIEASTVTLIHETAREFLVKSLLTPRGLHEGWQDAFNLDQTHNTLAKCCIWYLNSTTFDQEWVKLEGGKWKTSGLPLNTYIKQHPFVEYAAKYWTFHFKLSGVCAGDDLCSEAVRLCEANSSRYRTWSKIYWSSFNRRASSSTCDLSIAVAYDMVEVMAQLVYLGFDIDEQDSKGDTALHAAAIHGCYNAARWLIDHGASTNIKANHGNTPLHLAAARGMTSLVKLIIEHGGRLGDLNKQGRTPLHRAALFGHPDVVKELIDSGAELDVRDERGRTALHLASLFGTEDIKRLPSHTLKVYNVMKILVDAGSDPSIVDNDNATVSTLFEDAFKIHIEAIKVGIKTKNLEWKWV